MVQNSKAGVRWPPISQCMSSLRMRSPSKAGLYETGIGMWVILIFSPRTLMARSTISSTGTELTTCS